MTARAIAICGVLALGPFLLRAALSQTPDAKLPPPRRAATSDFLHVVSKFEFQGANSCSAASCHNGVRSEYSTWVSKDAHARAYEVLFNETSATISKNLGRLPAHEDALCLTCHVHPQFDKAKHPAFFAGDGVSCESCHGPAERWLAEHFRPEWATKSAKEKLDLGMCDTRSLQNRARLCVDCHVGSANADVNHDLIAAGHPRLNFEFGGAHARMPHHWRDARDKDPMYGGVPDFEARAWVIGQVVTAKAATELLAFRAGAPTGPANAKPQAVVWPEFAEYDCYKCHQRITASAGQPSEPGRKVGALFWNRWYLAMTPEADEGFAKLALEIRRAMEKPRPDRADIAQKSALAAERLQGWLQKSRLPDIIPATEWLKRMAKHDIATWDEAGQVYLALAAMHHAARDMSDDSLPPSFRGILEKLNGNLRFPPNQTSPRDFHPDVIRDTLRKLQ